MSSIGNGKVDNTNTGDAAALSPDQLAAQNLDLAARKNAAKILNAAKNGDFANLIELAGMTPADAANAISGAPHPKGNKYSAAGAARSLSPPTGPKAIITPETAGLYQSMHAQVNRTLGSVAEGNKPVNWAALSPTMHATQTQAESDKAVEAHTAAAAEALGTAFNQFSLIGGDAMTMAFMLAKSQGQSDSVKINSRMGELQASIRETDLNEQIKQDQEAEVKLEKAAKKMAAMKKAGPIIMAIITILTVLITVATLGTATGIALTLAASFIGFMAGGAAGGAKKGNGFDMESAMMGMSVGSMIVPVGAILNALVRGMITALEKVGLQAASKAARAATAKMAQKVGANGAVVAFSKASEAAGDAVKSSMTAFTKETSKLLSKRTAAETEALEKLGAEQATHSAATSSFAQTGAELQKSVATHCVAELRSLFAAMQKTLNSVREMPRQKAMSIVEWTVFTAQIVTGQAQATGNYVAAKSNNAAQEAVLLGKKWGMLVEIAQKSWKRTQDFLSDLQEQHSTGMKQAETMLMSHNQVLSKAIAAIIG